MSDDADELDQEFEVNPKTGESILVKSTDSSVRAYLRFTNRTSRVVDVYWRDFRGCRVFYVRLKPNTFHNPNSFLTHPWVFYDATTQERYVINNKQVFRPPASIGGMAYRSNWNITVPMRTLKWCTLLRLAESIPDASAINALGLPRLLALELQRLVAMVPVATQQVP